MRVEIYEDMIGEYRWRLLAKNGKVVGDSGEGYKTRWGCRRAARKFLGL